MDTTGIIGVIVGVIATVELGAYMPLSSRLEERSDRRARRIYLLVAMAAIITAAMLTRDVLNTSYVFSILVTILLFYIIYHVTKRIKK